MWEIKLRTYHIIYRVLEKRSFRSILVFSFVFISLVPILALQFLSDNRISENLQENMDRLSISNATQTKNNLRITLDAYNDLLYQIYTNDEIVRLIYEIDAGENQVVNVNQLQRTLRAMCYAKEGIESISIITAGGEEEQQVKNQVIYYDKLTASSVNSSWLDKEGLTKEAVFKKGIGDYTTKLLPTMFVMNVGQTPVYAFHMLRRMLDYKNIRTELGVVVLSLNENILHTICNQNMPQGTFSFIVDEFGRIVSYPEKNKIGSMLGGTYDHNDTASSESAYNELLISSGYLSKGTAIYYSDMENGWRVVTAVDQGSFYNEISLQKKNLLLVGIIIIAITVLLILTITALLSRSMNTVTAAMKQAQTGNLEVSVSENNVFSSEMMTIARTFNEMMKRIAGLIEEVKSATMRQKDSEIKLLEAQINPHFLYNILDSINWMAIDKDQFEISQMITSLAKILRYSINNSNATVPLRDEIDWLHHYIHLQQMRYKNNFDYTIQSDGNILDYKVHKLMLQPFVENSIVHGFAGSERKNFLTVSIQDKINFVQINIHDNGCGIAPETLDDINGMPKEHSDHIGMANAIGRIRMYYGDNADVIIDSKLGFGTTVLIRLAKGEVKGE